MNEQKKAYLAPQIEVMHVQMEQSICSASCHPCGNGWGHDKSNPNFPGAGGNGHGNGNGGGHGNSWGDW